MSAYAVTNEKGAGMKGYISRIVAVLTPLFAAGAAYAASEMLKLPGAPQLDTQEVTALMVAGAGAAAAAGWKWLDGRSKHELQAADHARSAEEEAAWRDAEAERPVDLMSLPPEDSIPKLRAMLGLDADPAVAAMAHLKEIPDRLNQIVAGVGALVERVETLETQPAQPIPQLAPTEIIVRSPHGNTRYSPIPEGRGGDAD